MYLRSGWIPLRVVAFGCVLVAIGAYCFCPSVRAQTSDSPAAEEPARSWTATTDLKSADLLPQRIPVRIVESHSQDGNRTLDKRSVEIRGTDGHLEPYQDIEKEALQLDASTVRTTTRTFGRDANGARTLVQVTEEEQHTLPGGDSYVVRITSDPDVNGRVKPVQREVVEAKRVGTDTEETNTTVMLPNINGGLAPAFKTSELRKRRADGTTESQKTTLLADGTGKWEVNETRQVTTSQQGASRTADERVFRRGAEGKLAEVSQVVTKQSENESGEKRETIETYSVDVPGVTRDGSLHLVERTTTARRTSATGEQVTEKKVEQPNPGDPRAGLRVSILVNDEMVPAPPGEQSTVSVRARDSNGSFGIVSVDTTRSDRIPAIQIQQTPAESRNKSSAD